jgi:hypothetical protein
LAVGIEPLTARQLIADRNDFRVHVLQGQNW